MCFNLVNLNILMIWCMYAICSYCILMWFNLDDFDALWWLHVPYNNVLCIGCILVCYTLHFHMLCTPHNDILCFMMWYALCIMICSLFRHIFVFWHALITRRIHQAQALSQNKILSSLPWLVSLKSNVHIAFATVIATVRPLGPVFHPFNVWKWNFLP